MELEISPIATVTGLPVLGSILPISRDALGFFTHILRTRGDRVALKVMGRNVLLLCHPDDIEMVLVRDRDSYGRSAEIEKLKPVFGEGLLSSSGDLWKRQRSTIQPVFGHAALSLYASIMLKSINGVLDNWISGSAIDMQAEMMRYTREVIWSVLFGECIPPASDLGAAVTTVFGDLRSEVLYLPLWRKLPFKRSRRWNSAVLTLNSAIRSQIANRRASGNRTGDMLDALLHATDSDGQRMSNEQLQDEILTFFLAGHETAALSLTWASYLLACNPEMQTQVKKEVSLVTSGGALMPSHLGALPVTTAVVKEALRLYPPVWSMGRRALHDTQLAGNVVAKGTDIWICLHRLHRDKRWFHDPERFLPDRWLSPTPAKPFTFLPFGVGPRVCIGQHFAMAEAVLGIASILSKFQILPPKHPAKASAWITLRPQSLTLDMARH